MTKFSTKRVCWICAEYYEGEGNDCGDEKTHKEIKKLLDYFLGDDNGNK